jgi:hypothetical protein
MERQYCPREMVIHQLIQSSLHLHQLKAAHEPQRAPVKGYYRWTFSLELFSSIQNGPITADCHDVVDKCVMLGRYELV